MAFVHCSLSSYLKRSKVLGGVHFYFSVGHCAPTIMPAALLPAELGATRREGSTKKAPLTKRQAPRSDYAVSRCSKKAAKGGVLFDPP